MSSGALVAHTVPDLIDSGHKMKKRKRSGKKGFKSSTDPATDPGPLIAALQRMERTERYTK